MQSSPEEPPLGQDRNAQTTGRTLSQKEGEGDRRTQQLLQRKSLTEHLNEVAKSEDAQELRAALLRAKAAHVDSRLLEGPELALKKLEAEEALTQAMEADDAEAIRRGLAGVRSLGKGKKSLVEDATKRLEKIQVADALRTALDLQLESGMLKLMIDDAIRVGLEKSLIDEAKERVKNIQKTWNAKRASVAASAARRSSVASTTSSTGGDKQQKMEEEVEKSLRHAIQFAESGALKMAIEPANKLGLFQELVAQAERVLAAIEAIPALRTALRTKDPAQLEAAIGKARTADVVGAPEFAQAELLLAQVRARDGLAAASRTKNEVELAEAIRAAREVGVERIRIGKAERLLLEVQGAALSPSGVGAA